MVQNEYLKQWQCDVTEKLIESGLAEPVLIIRNDGEYTNFRKPLWNKITKLNVLWRLYERVFLRKGPLKNVRNPRCLRKLPVLKCKVELRGRFSQYFSDKDIQKIATSKPDFILRFGFSIIRGDILNVAQYGIWSFHHSDENIIRGGPAGFWEVYRMHYVNGVILQRLTDHLDGGIILKKRFYKTQFHDCAFHIHHIIDSSTDMPVQVCADILNGCADYFHNEASVSKAHVYSWPTMFQMISFFFRQFIRRIRFNLRDLFIHEKWSLGIAEGSPEEIIKTGRLPESIHVFSKKTANTYPADPFAINTDNGLRIFYEDYSYALGKAGLKTMLLNERHEFVNPQTISTEKSHFSFPYVLKFENKVYIIPEQIEKGRVDVYEWVENTERLEFVKTIFPYPLADPVVFNENGLWWLFGSRPGKDVNNSLNIYFSESFLGEYIAHPQNPVVFDPRCARMAGAVFRLNGKLYRPAQESHIYYGKRSVIYEITEITRTSYREKFVTHIEPSEYSCMKKGLHTINFIPPVIVFDGKINVFSQRGFISRFIRKIVKTGRL